jgi:peroxiredoxin family protein
MNMTEENRHVAFICSKGSLDMVYPALVMGWAALGQGIDVTLFFTFWGLDMIRKDRVENLEISAVANPSMKMSMMGVPGNVGIPNFIGIVPGMTALATKLMKDKMAKLEVPTVPEYLAMLCDAGARLYACKMTHDMYGLTEEDYVDGVIGVASAADVIDMAEGAQLVFI